MTVSIENLPELSWTGKVGDASYADGVLTLTAEGGVDWTDDAFGGPAQHAATALVFDAPTEFALSARVAVDGKRTTFDAGVLCVWVDESHWAKLCFEYSPQGQPMVVSVVTNDYSDDVNSLHVDDAAVFLRVTRVGPGWAFHSSGDGRSWDFVRIFRLHTDQPARVGFLSQAPMGDACVARFDRITLSASVPTDLRDGS